MSRSCTEEGSNPPPLADPVVKNRKVEEPPFRSGIVGLPTAVSLLRHEPGRMWGRMECLWVDFSLASPTSSPSPGSHEAYRTSVGEFVNALERYPHVSKLHLENATFSGWDEEEEEQEDDKEGGDDDDPRHVVDSVNNVDLAMDRLFGTVLPNHPSLTHLEFDYTTIHLRYMTLFKEGLTNNPSPALRKLELDSTPLTVEHARLLMCILQHDNVRVRVLRLWHCGLGSDGLRMVCRGAATSQHLVTLSVGDEMDVLPGTVVSAAVVGPHTKLEQLFVEAKSWSPAALAELVEALRVNTRLLHVSLGQRGRFHEARLVEDLVRTYNFSLMSVDLDPRNENGRFQDGTDQDGPIGTLLRRNRRVRGVVRAFLEPDNYGFSNRALWPRVLQEFITFPTLLYRFVRRGNVKAFADQVGRAPRGRRRRRQSG